MGIRPPMRKFVLIGSMMAMNLAIAGAVHFGWSDAPAATAASKPAAILLTEEERIMAVVEKSSSAVVSILVQQPIGQAMGVGVQPKPEYEDQGHGTGFIVSADGMVVTNRHVASGRKARYTVFLQDGRSMEASVLDIDPVNDLALLRIPAKGLTTLALEADDRVKIGQTVIAIGNALGKYANTVTRGILSGVERSVEASNQLTGGTERLEDILQTDAAINSGNSGGPLLNLDGKVIGVNTAVELGGQGLGFAIPVSEVRKVVTSFSRYGAIARPRLGIRYLSLSPDIALQRGLVQTTGAYVHADPEDGPAVVPGSPAAAAGIRQGDIILEINGKPLEGKRTLGRIIQSLSVGDAITLKILRGAEVVTMTVPLDAHPPFTE